MVYFFLFFVQFCFYCLCSDSCSGFSSLFLPPPSPTISPPQANPHIVVSVHGLCINVIWLILSPFFNPFPPPPFQQLFVCFMCLSFCYYFVHQFLVFVSFHIQVRSCGIILSLTGLVQLIEFSPDLSMLLQNVSFFLLAAAWCYIV